MLEGEYGLKLAWASPTGPGVIRVASFAAALLVAELLVSSEQLARVRASAAAPAIPASAVRRRRRPEPVLRIIFGPFPVSSRARQSRLALVATSAMALTETLRQ